MHVQLLDALNAPQREAVVHGDGPLLVFAGAGSGKTRVITYRIAHLVRERGLGPWQVLAVTFTNKAAGEMRARVGRLLGEDVRDAWIGTFHATCARLLRRYADRALLRRDFVIYDDSDQRAMVQRCLKKLGLDDRKFTPRGMQAAINAAKQCCIEPERYKASNYFEDQVLKIYTLYEEQMLAAGALDFADLLFKAVRLLEREEGVLAELERRFLHLLVDEFQDTNQVQYALLKLLSRSRRNLCVVGDDDQSIYRWRGADVRNILDFQKDYPDAKVVLLEQNYRSTARVLQAASAVIKRNRARAPKTLWTENADGAPIRVVTLEDEREEARFVVRTVSEEVARGASPGDVAVFYRINAQSRVIEEALRAANMPYRVIGGVRFYERAEVKDLIAYLRVVQNPSDSVDLVRIINTPARGIGAATIERLEARAEQEGTSLYEALEHTASDPTGAAGTRRRLEGLIALLSELRTFAASARPSELAAAVLEKTGYLDVLKNEDTAEADARIENLKELVGSFEQFEIENESPTLESLLESLSLQGDVDDLEETPRSVTLMTVHSAKGLEFPSVILTGLEERIFPYQQAEAAEDPEELEEERRLCYVALTRARERLCLTNVARRRLFGTERYNQPSRFLSDIPSDVVTVEGIAPVEVSSFGRGFADSPRRYGGAETSRRPAPAHGARGKSAREEPPPVRVVAEIEGQEVTAGTLVRHPTFGVGRVSSVDQGSEPKLTVDFPGVGRKKLVARFLTPA